MSDGLIAHLTKLPEIGYGRNRRRKRGYCIQAGSVNQVWGGGGGGGWLGALETNIRRRASRSAICLAYAFSVYDHIAHHIACIVGPEYRSYGRFPIHYAVGL